MMKKIPLLITLAMLIFPLSLQAHDTDAKHMKKKDAVKLYIIEPKNGETVSQIFTAKFALEGFGIAPAGTNKENTGHHHLLIDMEKLPDLTKTLPATDNIKHFGGGQTETELTLPPGEHTLQLLLGDYLHVPHAKPIISRKITIVVK